MPEPKPYSPTDSAEQDAVTVFNTLVDSRFVKVDIRTRDKYPNIDGTVELVDERQVPLGKLDVQVRTIGKDHTKYNCPVTLVGYSTKSTSPILLVCVDISNSRAFWKRITSDIPEFKGKENQQTFTVQFTTTSDLIDDTGIYIQKWREITRDYQDRIAKFPSLNAEVANKLKLQGIEFSDRELFQRFIDGINNLFDNDFAAIKKLLYPSDWKLGVGIVSSDHSHVQYQLYTIPYGDPSPLVIKMSGGSPFNNQWTQNAVCSVYSSRDNIADPIKAGRDFVLEEARKIIEQKALPLYGQMLAADILIAFVDLYYRCLDLSPGLGRYSVKDLEYALNQHLIRMCAAFVSKITNGGGAGYFVDLDWFSGYLRTTNIEPLVSGNMPTQFFIGSKSFPVRATFDSLRYLIANQVKDVERPFGIRDHLPSTGANWIWSGYTPKNEINSVTRILNSSLAEYSAFILGNSFRFPNSPYLDSNTSIIFEYEPAKPGANSLFDGPGLREHHIDNTRHTLPKLLAVVRDQEHHRVDSGKFPNIEFDGTLYNAYSSSHGVASFFFHHTPLLNMVYRMLSADLSRHYNMTISNIMF